MPTLDDLRAMGSTMTRGRNKSSVTFLPEPEPRPRAFPIISVDDHVVEPAHTFEGRLPTALQERAPRVVEEANGDQVWVFEHVRESHTGLNAVAGRPIEECGFEPTRFEHMRKGAYDPDARVHDMDINGIYASLNFPSALAGFAGQRLQLNGIEPDLGLATVRAWNDWILEEWVQAHPDRFIACQLPWLLDPDLAAAEIRRNAERGFKAVTFTEGPDKLGLPSLHSGYWEPFMQACEETGTVVCLHVGSSSTVPDTSPEAPPDTIGVLFFGYAMFYAVDWLYSMIPVRHPGLQHLHVRGWCGLGRRPPGPARPHIALPPALRDVDGDRPHPGRSVEAKLLLLRHRRPVRLPAGGAHRGRATAGRVRLPAPRLDLAGHPAAAAAAPGPSRRGHHSLDHVGERVPPLPASGAGGGAAGSPNVLIIE